MVCQECEKYKKMLTIHIDDLREYVEKDKELKNALEQIVKTVVREKVEEPKSWYKFPEGQLTDDDVAKWFEATENMYHFAKRYEEQERGMCCSVDRAYSDWLKPECKKLLNQFHNMGNTITGEFITGFIEGEGCFSLNYFKAKGKKGNYLRPMFSLGLNVRDKPLLEKIQKIFRCGRIYDDKNNNCYSYRIYRYDELKNHLIPFFDKYQFHGSKKIAFENFKKIMEIISKKQHLTKEGHDKLVVLKKKISQL